MARGVVVLVACVADCFGRTLAADRGVDATVLLQDAVTREAIDVVPGGRHRSLHGARPHPDVASMPSLGEAGVDDFVRRLGTEDMSSVLQEGGFEANVSASTHAGADGSVPKAVVYTVEVMDMERGASFIASAPAGCKTFASKYFYMKCIYKIANNFTINVSHVLTSGRPFFITDTVNEDTRTQLIGAAAAFQEMVPPPFSASCPICTLNCTVTVAGKAERRPPPVPNCGTQAMSHQFTEQALPPAKLMSVSPPLKVEQKTTIKHHDGSILADFIVTYAVAPVDEILKSMRAKPESVLPTRRKRR